MTCIQKFLKTEWDKIKIIVRVFLIMNAKIVIGGKEHDIPPGPTICDTVRSIGFAPDTFIFMIGGRPVPMDTPVTDGILIKAVKVASGG